MPMTARRNPDWAVRELAPAVGAVVEAGDEEELEAPRLVVTAGYEVETERVG